MDKGRPAGTDGDTQLAARVAQGDKAALATLYDRYAAIAYGLARRLVGDAASDVVHEAFVVLLERPQMFDAERGSFRAWFLASVHHRCLSYIRGRARMTGDDGIDMVADPRPDPAEQVVRSLREGAVQDALFALPEPQREAIVLAYYGGMSQTALASHLHTPVGTIKARMRRGLIALRNLLHDDPLLAEERTE